MSHGPIIPPRQRIRDIEDLIKSDRALSQRIRAASDFVIPPRRLKPLTVNPENPVSTAGS